MRDSIASHLLLAGTCLLMLTVGWDSGAVAAIPPDPTPGTELTGHDFVVLAERCATAHETVESVEDAVVVSRECGELDGFVVGLLGGVVLESRDRQKSETGVEGAITSYCLEPEMSFGTALIEAREAVQRAGNKDQNVAAILISHFRERYACEP